jgi:hypothetical protein
LRHLYFAENFQNNPGLLSLSFSSHIPTVSKCGTCCDKKRALLIKYIFEYYQTKYIRYQYLKERKLKKTLFICCGGKQTILPVILPLIPEHSVYTEAYANGYAILFAKHPVKCEIINDLNGEPVNFTAYVNRSRKPCEQKSLAEDKKPVTDWQMATFQTDYDPYKNLWLT